MVLRSGDVILAKGDVESRLAAQVASQIAHESWLREKPKRNGTQWNGPYVWRAKEQP